jgi:hypothetical protein
MYSGRRWCVQRHIDDLHKGKANAIPFVEYVVGRKEGLYPPAQKPSYGSQKKRSLEDKMEDELQNVFARNVAESYLPRVGDRAYHAAIIDLKDHIDNQHSRSHRNQLLEMLEFLQTIKKQKGDTEATRTDGSRKYEDMQDYNLGECIRKLGFVQTDRKQNMDTKKTTTGSAARYDHTHVYDLGESNRLIELQQIHRKRNIASMNTKAYIECIPLMFDHKWRAIREK